MNEEAKKEPEVDDVEQIGKRLSNELEKMEAVRQQLASESNYLAWLKVGRINAVMLTVELADEKGNWRKVSVYLPHEARDDAVETVKRLIADKIARLYMQIKDTLSKV
jgi:hypothetical protein